MNWSELKNNKSHLFLNYLKIKADKFVKDTKCHLCLKSFSLINVLWLKMN